MKKIISEVTMVLRSLERCRSEDERAAAQDLIETLALIEAAEDNGIDVRALLKDALDEREYSLH